MHCSQARNQIALLVGDDIDDSDRPEVERHLSECKSCHSYRDGLASTHEQLQMLSAEDSGVMSASLWPEMEPAVRLANSDRGSRRLNGWAVGLAVAATVMAMFAMSGDLGPVRYDDGNSEMSPPPSGVFFNRGHGEPSLAPNIAEEKQIPRRFDFDELR